MTEDFYVDCNWGKAFVRKYLGDESKQPIVALHGWLDNCASFEFLADYIDHPIYAIDLPGHGFSSHQANGNWYHLVDYVEKTRETILQLPDIPKTIMGHSMGAAIGAIYASIFPDEVSKLIMIDGLGPLVNSPEETPGNLRKALLERSKVSNKKRKPFKTLEMAAGLRKSVGQLSDKAALALVKQQLSKKDDGYYWTYDHKLNFTSSLRMTPEQLTAFYQELSCPTLLIKASDGLLLKVVYKQYLESLSNLSEIELDGHHHLHMDNPQVVAIEINKFL